MELDTGLVHVVASGAAEALESTQGGHIDTVQSERTLAEVLLFVAGAMQELTVEILGVDNDDDDCCDDDDDDGDNDAKLRAIHNLDSDTLEKIYAWVELTMLVNNYFLVSIPTALGPPELLLQYIQMWNSFPQFLDIMACRGNPPISRDLSFTNQYYNLAATSTDPKLSYAMARGLEVLRYAFGLYPRDVLEALQKAVTACRSLVSYHSLKFAEWLLSYAAAADQILLQGVSDRGLVVPLASVDFYFFRVCGHYLKSTCGLEGSQESKRLGVSYCTSLICTPLTLFLQSTQAELDTSTRAEECYRARHKLSRSMQRLRGLAKAMVEDDVFMSFVQIIGNSVFEVALTAAETYEWMRGRKLNGDAAGIDVYIDTGHCHVGEGIAGRDQAMSEMGKLVNTSVDLLCTLFDCQLPVDSPSEWSAFITTSLEKVGRIVEFVQSTRVMQLVSVLLRWGAQSDQDDIRDHFSQLIAQLILHTQRKLDDPLLDRNACDWLAEEWNGCASLARQIFVSDMPIFVNDVSTSGQTGSSCVALHFMRLTTSMLNQDAYLLETSPLTPRLFGAVYGKWEPIAAKLLEDVDFRAMYQQTACELLAALLSGLFYSSLANKIKNWTELFHSVLASLHEDGTTSEILCEIVYNICINVFDSSMCRRKCDKWNESPVPDNAIVAINDRSEAALVGVEESATNIASCVVESFQKSRRKNSLSILENLCRRYQITS
jgi:hypothetical protein